MALGVLGKGKPESAPRPVEYVVGARGTWFRKDPDGVRMDQRKSLWVHPYVSTREWLEANSSSSGNGG